MKRQKLKARVFVELNGESVLWYELDEEGAVTWRLPKEVGGEIKAKMLKNIGGNMSRYMLTHKDCSLWEATDQGEK